MKQWADYIDEYGLVVHLTPEGGTDGGDSGQRFGMYWIGRGLEYNFNSHDFAFGLKHLEIKPGIFVRHPNSNAKWHSDPTEFSRDQHTPLAIAMGFAGTGDSIKAMILNHVKRLGRYQNKDYGWPIGIYTRAMRAWYLYPLLLLSDTWLLLGVLIRVIVSHLDPDNVGDDLNCICELLQAKLIYPTPVSYLARLLYTKLRYKSPQYALDHYFRHIEAPPMNTLPFTKNL